MLGDAFIQEEQAVCWALLQLKDPTYEAKKVCCVSFFYYFNIYKFDETLGFLDMNV